MWSEARHQKIRMLLQRHGRITTEDAIGELGVSRETVRRDFLALDDDAFRALFSKSPIKRIKRARFLRNVCVVLGNTGSEEDLPALQRAAADPDPLIAEHAAWAVEKLRKAN